MLTIGLFISPVYHGGLIKEIVFDTVVSNSESGVNGNPTQPLGTQAGRGMFSNKHKGGYVHFRTDEHSIIMGIASITPRIDYSQGNEWDTTIYSINDYHKPDLDEIGFQELITEGMAWWTTQKTWLS